MFVNAEPIMIQAFIMDVSHTGFFWVFGLAKHNKHSVNQDVWSVKSKVNILESRLSQF